MSDKVDQRSIDVYHIETPKVSESECSFLLYGKTKSSNYCRVRVKMSRAVFCHFAGYVCRNIAKQFEEKLRNAALVVAEIFNKTW